MEANVNKSRKGYKESYRLLFEKYYRPLCLYALGLTGNRMDAEDLVQNVFMNLWKKKDHLNIYSSVKSYLYKSVYNMFANDFKRKKKERKLLDKIHYEVLQEHIEEEVTWDIERLKLIDEKIEELPPKSREVFIMSKKRGLACTEIAYMLNISEHTVESHIVRALKRIRTEIAGSLPFQEDV